MNKHKERTGILTTLPASIQAMLCGCDACFEVWMKSRIAAAERDRVNRHKHPLCEFCLSPMVWRGFVYVCPYAETGELHAEIREMIAPELRRSRTDRRILNRSGGFPLQ